MIDEFESRFAISEITDADAVCSLPMQSRALYVLAQHSRFANRQPPCADAKQRSSMQLNRTNALEQHRRFANHNPKLADAVKSFPLATLGAQQADNSVLDQSGMALARGLTEQPSLFSDFDRSQPFWFN